ncbi:MAG TPA: hypothetical protein VG102_00015 [Candidatus Paceibacterota bacterium]|jgi:drug/metabolite transporter (DMT)-like permease|nr:hypothetical protein [Candidatus Paceibacterota bacterium]
MLDTVSIVIVFLSAILIAIADAIIKELSLPGKFYAAVFSPWMIAICVLYFIQILMALYVFVHKGDLAIYANVFIVFYSLCMVLLGMLYFGEQLTFVEGLGICLALAGVILLNSNL